MDVITDKVSRLLTIILAPVIFIAAGMSWVPQAFAQDEENGDAPQILTSDLSREMTAEAEVLTVNFVFIDSDSIVRVVINGQEEQITPGDTVMVSREFRFTEDKTLVTVTATDSEGNTHEKSYLVYRPGLEVEKKLDINFFLSYSMRYENDSNPVMDLSLPFGLQVGEEITGAVDDAEQADVRNIFEVITGAVGENWNAFLGQSATFYVKPENSPIESRVNFLGGGYRFGSIAAVNVTMLDLNVGGYDYAFNTKIAPEFRLSSKDDEGSTSTHRFILDFTSKDFASDNQVDGTQTGLTWRYRGVDPEKQDIFISDIAFGDSTEGVEKTDYSYFKTRLDWYNRWDSGIKFDIGFGIEHRNYPNDLPLSTETPLGAKRVDMPGRISFGLGYQYKTVISVMWEYTHLFNISNKAPYERILMGFVVKGSF
ncbi:MAG: hypothetical protein OEZ59_09905 [Deltaproteobacteria bacterium]|nr:hypothetical protein [Deltaproteobacteria bacterium]